MEFRVREILLVATLYDAFILEQEDKLTEKIFGEYYQLNLSTAPRITSVSFSEEALDILSKKHFDMVILTMRIDEMTPFELGKKIKGLKPSIPLMLLLNDNSDIKLVTDRWVRWKYFDKIFVWNGDAKIFLAMIKYIEDKINVVKDTKIGLVRVILLVEDSIRYCSRYLPTLYSEIMKQTQRLIADEHLEEMNKLLRMRARPKVLMAESYEEALEILDLYEEYLICVISDVKFPMSGRIDNEAGIKLLHHVKNKLADLPTVLQSSDPDMAREAVKFSSTFIDKNSDNLSRDITDFIFKYLGFGDFIFRNERGTKIGRAESIEKFKLLLKTIPDESLVYHANRNHFSSWLMARGEIKIAESLRPVRVSDFSTPEGLRNHLIDVCRRVHEEKTKGKIILYDESIIEEDSYVIRMGEGSLGGKGRGMAFLNMLFQNWELSTTFSEVNIRIPPTSIIGTEEYDYFIEHNHFERLFNEERDYTRVKKLALKGRLSSSLRKKLKVYLENISYPISVRSSGLFEDSISQPFSGVYDTFLLPNSHPDINVRLRHVEEAIKLVYASVFSSSARSYFEAINYKISQEKMAVLIQVAVGNRNGKHYYPHFSGVAQSYNYYPVSYLKPEDGIAIIGFGFGKYVIDGEKAHRFCPKYPKLDFLSPEDQLKNSQTSFYAINMEERGINLMAGEDAALLRLNISDAEKDGTLNYCVSVWDEQNNRMQVGSAHRGSKIVNFSYILKYDYFPLASTLKTVMEMIKSVMGTPVEIEFAVDLIKDKYDKPSLYILQIKPLLSNIEDYNLDISEISREELFIYTEKAMGNGMINDLYDIIYVDPDSFDKTKTVEMAAELEKLNTVMKDKKRDYILIGPGRWGSRDRWLGIPVLWSHISNARIIVEVELRDYKIDPSLGSHFFHNVTSMHIGYFDIPYGSSNNFIDWKWLKNQSGAQKHKYFIQARLVKPLVAKMDGRKSISVVYKPEKPQFF
jgi:CheY-like chemotaxis protein